MSTLRSIVQLKRLGAELSFKSVGKLLYWVKQES